MCLPRVGAFDAVHVSLFTEKLVDGGARSAMVVELRNADRMT